MDLKFENKTALVTGSTAGIGFAIAMGLAKEGAHVVINGRSEMRVDAAVARVKAEQDTGSVRGVAADCGTKEGIRKILMKEPQVDILVNNVGIFEPKEFQDISDESWSHLFEVNVMSGIRLSRHYFPRMLENNWGRVLFISSESGVQIPEEMIHYGMTKTAQIAVANGLARLTKGTNVTVNTVLPGSTMSEGAGEFIGNLAKEKAISKEQVEKDFFTKERPSSLLQRFATTKEVANMVVYLCSPLASATNGACVRVDGGTIPTIL